METERFEGSLNEALEHFEQLWRDGTPPNISEHLPSTDDLASGETRSEWLEELVLVDLEYRWKVASGDVKTAVAGGPGDLPQSSVGKPALVAGVPPGDLPLQPEIDCYLSRFPELKTDISQLARLVQEEYRVRKKVGDAPDHANYVDRFGDQLPNVDHLLSQVDADIAIEATSVGLGNADTTQPPASTNDESQTGSPSSGSQRFELIERLGEGGQGEVWLSHDPVLGRQVAFKVVKPQWRRYPQTVAKFQREAEITGRLEHPNIVPVYDGGQSSESVTRLASPEKEAFSDSPWYAMRVIGTKRTLQHAIKEFHSEEWSLTTLRELLGNFVDVCNAMSFAHNRGVIHRDLKPQNIMLGEFGETLVVDWGLARAEGTSDLNVDVNVDAETHIYTTPRGDETGTGTILGTETYMAPEQARGEVKSLDESADIYSMGAILYAVLTGRPPVIEQPIRDNVIAGKFPRPRELKRTVPGALEAICLKALQTEAQNRYDSVKDMEADVQCWLNDQPVSQWKEPLLTRASRWVRRHQLLAASTSAAILVAVITLSILAAVVSNKNSALAQLNKDVRENLDIAKSSVDRFMVSVAQDPRMIKFGLEPVQREIFEEAQVLYDRILRQEPMDLDARIEQARLLLHQGIINAEIETFRAGILYLDKSVTAFRKLLQQTETDEIRFELAIALRNAGYQQMKLRQLPKSKDSQVEAAAIFAQLTETHPENANYRREQGIQLTYLGEYFLQIQDYKNAESEFEKSYDVLSDVLKNPVFEQTAAEQGEARYYHGMNLFNLGIAIGSQGRLKESGPWFKQANEVYKKLESDFPDNPKYLSRVARSYSNLASWHAQMGNSLLRNDKPKAIEHFLDAAENLGQAVIVGEKLVKRHTALVEPRANLMVFRKDLLATCAAANNTAATLANDGQIDKLDDVSRQLVDLLHQVTDASGHKQFTVALTNFSVLRCNILWSQKRYTEAAILLERLLPKVPSRSDIKMRLQRSYLLQRSYAVAAEQALEIGRDPSNLAQKYNAACLLALAAQRCLADSTRPEQDRSDDANQYASQALKQLREAARAGHFKNPRNLRQLNADHDLDFLRARADFTEFLKGL